MTPEQTNPHVAHRGGLATRVERLYPAPTLLRRVGGRQAVARLVEELYDRIEADEALAPKFVNDTKLEREKQKCFFEEWLGGEPLYSQRFAFRSLRDIHEHIHVSAQDAARWLGHFAQAMQAAGFASDARDEVRQTLRPLAEALINEQHEATRYEHRCHRGKRGQEADRAVRKADLQTLASLLEGGERVAEWGPGALCSAAGRGKRDVVERLLELGVDVNRAAPTEWTEGYQTPLHVARLRRKRAVEELLREHGAVDDIFSDAALGDLAAVEAWVEKDPSLLEATDPAQDVYAWTALHHAVFADQHDLALALLGRGASPGRLDAQLVRAAAEAECVPLVEKLLECGANATRVGPGRWVLHPELSPLLRANGADVNYAPTPHSSWIWDACTGNHSQKDDAEYVSGLLEHGADVDADYGWGRFALHFAAKAGYAETVRVLLAAGASPNQRDLRDGQTPLFYAFRAGKSVDPTVVASILLEHGADPSVADRIGKTVRDRSRQAAAFLDERGL